MNKWCWIVELIIDQTVFAAESRSQEKLSSDLSRGGSSKSCALGATKIRFIRFEEIRRWFDRKHFYANTNETNESRLEKVYFYLSYDIAIKIAS